MREVMYKCDLCCASNEDATLYGFDDIGENALCYLSDSSVHICTKCITKLQKVNLTEARKEIDSHA